MFESRQLRFGCRIRLLVAVVAGLDLGSAPIDGAESRWAVESGDWSVVDNWDPRAPRAEDLAIIDNGGIVTIDPREVSVASLILGKAAGGVGFVEQEGGRHDFGELRVGEANGARGGYYLGNGELSADEASIGIFGSGSLTNAAGLHLVESSLSLGEHAGSQGNYVLEADGALFVNGIRVGNEGEGALVIKDGLVWGDGQGNSVHRIELGRDGGSGSVEIHDGGDLRFRFAEFASGTMRQLGGTNRIEARMRMGRALEAEGNYVLNGGRLETGEAVIAEFGLAELRQTGGIYDAGELTLAEGKSGEGTYELTGGKLTAWDLVVGGNGHGHLAIDSPEIGIDVKNLLQLGPKGQISAPEGATIGFSGVALENRSQGEGRFEALSNVTLHVRNADHLATLEASTGEVWGSLVVGGSQPSEAWIVDEVDNDDNGEIGDELFRVGTLNLGPGAVVDLNGFGLRAENPVVLSAGRVRLYGGSFEASSGLTLSNEAAVVGGGTIKGDVINSGEVDLSESTNGLKIEGEFRQGDSGELRIRLSEAAEGGSHRPPLSVGGNATLGGRLTVTMTQGMDPTPGQYFKLARCRTIDGEFAASELPTLSDNLSWRTLADRRRVVIAPVEAGPPRILSGPADKTVLSGEPVRFHVLAVGKPSPEFRWVFNGSEIPDAVGRSLTLETSQPSHTGDYQVIIENRHGRIQSEPARLVVEAESAPQITRAPQSKEAHVNDRASFSVEAAGTPDPTYQWLYEGSPLSEETGSQLTLSAVTPEDEGEYAVRVGNSSGSVVSPAAMLSVAPFEELVTVAVKHPGNPNDSRVSEDGTRHGAVDVPFRMGRSEINNFQYTAFLNAVAEYDYFDLYNEGDRVERYRGIVRQGDPGAYSYEVKEGMGFKPVNFVSFFDLIRFANWWHNGRPEGLQDTGTTEAGAYLLTKQRKNPRGQWVAEISGRRPAAKWFLPSESEWHKAAFYDPEMSEAGGYWRYATRRDAPPIPEPPPGGENSANYAQLGEETGSIVLTKVGRYFQSESAFGTRGQNGNVEEWTEGARRPTSRSRMVRGGHGGSNKRMLQSEWRHDPNWDEESYVLGGRLARRSSEIEPMAPNIHLEPFDETVFTGEDAVFVVQATGVPTPDFQWEKNGEPIPGATQRRLLIEGVEPEDVGHYRALVNNGHGTATTRAAELGLFAPDATYARWATPGTGAWGAEANWASESLPEVDDHTIIDRPEGVFRIDVTGIHKIRSLYSNERLTIQGGELRVAETVKVNHIFRMRGGALIDATVQRGRLSGQVLHFAGADEPVLRNVTMNADMNVGPFVGLTSVAEAVLEAGLELNGEARINDRGKLFVDGIQQLTGEGEIQIGPIGGDVLLRGNSEWTIGEGMAIRGGITNRVGPDFGGRIGAHPEFESGSSVIINHGRIRSDVANGQLNIEPDRFINEGLVTVAQESELVLAGRWANRATIRALSGSTLTLGRKSDESSWDNTGVIQATQAVVRLGGAIQPVNLGKLEVRDSEIRLIGEIENLGTEVRLRGEGSSWVLAGGTIQGGVISAGGSETLQVARRRQQDDNTLLGVTVASNLDMAGENAYLQARNGLFVKGAIELGRSAQLVLHDEPMGIAPEGRLRGEGSVEGTISNRGMIQVGMPIGELTIEGDLQHRPAGRVEFTLGADEHDHVDVAGSAALDGELAIGLTERFRPSEGVEVSLMSFERRSGRFESYELPLLEEGLAWAIDYDSDQVTLSVENGADNDGDGIHDQWEELYGLDPSREEDAEADPDGDGASNRREFLAHTDPRDGDSVLRIRNVEAAGDGLRISVATIPGLTYRLESASAVGSREWEVLGEEQLAAGPTIEFEVPLESISRHYFRVRLIE